MTDAHVPEVSVVVPTYNRASFVHEAVDSCLMQEGVKLEVIVVDDGSTDDTAEVMARYEGDPRLRYFQGEHEGSSRTRNRGIELARAPWLACLDSDDVWLPEKLAHQFAELEQRPEAICHVTNVFTDRPGADRADLITLRGMGDVFEGDAPIYLPAPLEFNVRHNFARVQTMLARRDAVIAAGCFSTSGRYFEDTDLMNRLALQGPWVVSPEVTAHEMRRKESDEIGIGAQRRKQMYTGYEDLCRQMTTLLEDHGEKLSEAETRIVREKLTQYGLTAVTELIKDGDTQFARTMLSRTRPGAPSRKGRLLRLLLTVPALARAVVR